MTILLGFGNQCLAQEGLGVKWEPPQNGADLIAQLDTLERIGTDYLLVDQTLDTTSWNLIENRGLSVYGIIPIYFPTVTTLSTPDKQLLDKIRIYVNHYSAQPSVKAIALFSYGATTRPAFEEAIAPYTEQIRGAFTGPLFYIKNYTQIPGSLNGFDFSLLTIPLNNQIEKIVKPEGSQSVKGIWYCPTDNTAPFLTPFKRFLENNFQTGDSLNLIISSDWLFRIIDKYPHFTSILEQVSTEEDVIIALPQESIPGKSGHNLIVLLLIISWGFFIVIYNINPVFRKSLKRYFLSHGFLVDDVMDRHIRSSTTAILMILQNVILTGICIYSLAASYLSPLGLEAFFHHLPNLQMAGSPLLSFLLIGCLFSLSLALISILWISLSSFKFTYLSQILNLYSWPVQAGYIPVTILVALLMAGAHNSLILITAVAFMLIQLIAFPVTAIDLSRYLRKNKAFFMAGTFGLYLILLLGGVVLFISSNIPEILALALSLS